MNGTCRDEQHVSRLHNELKPLRSLNTALQSVDIRVVDVVDVIESGPIERTVGKALWTVDDGSGGNFPAFFPFELHGKGWERIPVGQGTRRL